MEKGHQTQLLDLLREVHITVVHLWVGSRWARIKEIVTKNNTILLREGLTYHNASGLTHKVLL